MSHTSFIFNTRMSQCSSLAFFIWLAVNFFFFSVGVLNLFAVHTGILKRTGRVIIAIGLCFFKINLKE